MPYIPGAGTIDDVYHSPNVFVNNVEVALWLEAQDSATAAAILLNSPDIAFAVEQADGDGISAQNTSTGAISNTPGQAVQNTQNIINQGTASGVIGPGSSVLTPVTTDGPTDTSTGIVSTGTVITSDWSKFNQDNIPYDTLMLTPKTSLATFTTKAALWPNQPTPFGPDARQPGSGDNKHIKAQYGLTVPQILHNLSNLAANVWEPFKARYPNALITNTFRQGPPGGKYTQAQHGTGQAMDIQLAGGTPAKYYEAACWVRDNLPFDQLLQEKAGGTIWIHVSHYSGFGTKVSSINRVANMVVSPGSSFTPGLTPYA